MSISVSSSTMYSKGVRRGAVWARALLVTCAVLIVIGGIYWLMSPDPEKLLNVDPLTPAQIRVVAVKLLLHSDVKLRAQASAKLTSAGSTAVPVLKDLALRYSDTNLRVAVLSLLISMDPDGTVEVLERLVNDPETDVRGAAVSAAAQLRGPRAVAILETALKDPEPGIRSSAAGAFAASVDAADAKKAVGSLTALLDDPSNSVRRHAARALHNITGADYSNASKKPGR